MDINRLTGNYSIFGSNQVGKPQNNSAIFTKPLSPQTSDVFKGTSQTQEQSSTQKTLQLQRNFEAQKSLELQKADTFAKNAQAQEQPSTQKASQFANFLSGFGNKLLLKSFLNKKFIDGLAEKNPKIKELLSENGVDYEVHPENVSNIINSHLATTTDYAMQMADELGLDASDRQALEQACMFHDFGKALIPDEVLNKPGRLTAEEKKIMDLHSQLGYELLSQTSLSPKVLNLIKDHHNPNNKLSQILSVADIYSALREERCYKEPMSINEAFSILDQKVEKGEVNSEVVKALKTSVIGDDNEEVNAA